MNIIVATTSFPSVQAPFRGVFLERDLQGLVARGHTATCLVARSWPRERSSYRSEARSFLVHEKRYLSVSSVRGFEYLFSGFAQGNATRALRQLLRQNSDEPDILYGKFLNTAPLLAVARPGVARVLGVGEGLDSVQDRLAFFRKGEFDRYLECSDIVEVKNREVADWFSRRYGIENRIRVVPSGVETSFFQPGNREAARSRLGIGDERFVVACIGSRGENKGGDRVLAACRESTISEILPVMAGPGWKPGDRDYLALGVVRTDLVKTVLVAADLFVLPSLSEGMPNALLEALSVGLPCIVADRPYAEFLEHGRNCLKVNPLSIPDIERAIALLYSSKTLCRELGTAAREVARSMSQEARVDRLESIFNEAVAIHERQRS